MATTQALSCPACGAPVEPEEGSGVARCRFCHAVVRVPVDPRAGTTPPAVRRPNVPLPKRITVEETAHGFRIVRRWFHPKYLVFAVFTAIWFGALAVFFGVARASGAPAFFFLFPLLHVAVGLGIAYVTLCGFVNRTTIAAERGSLEVGHAPLPWPGRASFPAEDVTQVFVREKVHARKDGSSTTTYQLHVVTRAGEAKRLLSSLPDVEQALFLEQELERRLRLADRSVPGEVSRT